MRNASDIFCLNEEVTDGNQMFSVNGSCPLKIRRRTQPRENECFEYGRASIPDDLDRGDARFEKLDEEKMDEAYLEKRDDPENPASESGEKSPEIHKEVNTSNFHKVGGKKSGGEKLTPVSSSNMQRNPLTGAGMEIEQHKKSKKGRGLHGDRWMW